MATQINTLDQITISKPLHDMVRPLNEGEISRLKADIEQRGIRTPIVVWENAKGKLVCVDGHHRLNIAKELGLDASVIPFKVYDDISHDDAKVLAMSLNECRRQLTKAELTAEVHKMVAEGKSTRMIAKALGVTQSKAARAAKTAPVKPETVTDVKGHTRKAGQGNKNAKAGKGNAGGHAATKPDLLARAKKAFDALDAEQRLELIAYIKEAMTPQI